MVSTPEEITGDSPSLFMTQTTVNKTSARKSLRLFASIVDVKKRTAILHVGAAKSKWRAIKYVWSLWTDRQKAKFILKLMNRLNVISING